MPEYELVTILSPILSQDEANTTWERLRGVITEEGGTITHEESWGARRLAYPISKAGQRFLEGNYHLTRFDSDRANNGSIEAHLKLADSVIRYLLVKAEGPITVTPRPAEPRPVAEATAAPAPPAAEPVPAQAAPAAEPEAVADTAAEEVAQASEPTQEPVAVEVEEAEVVEIEEPASVQPVDESVEPVDAGPSEEPVAAVAGSEEDETDSPAAEVDTGEEGPDAAEEDSAATSEASAQPTEET